MARILTDHRLLAPEFFEPNRKTFSPIEFDNSFGRWYGAYYQKGIAQALSNDETGQANLIAGSNGDVDFSTGNSWDAYHAFPNAPRLDSVLTVVGQVQVPPDFGLYGRYFFGDKDYDGNDDEGGFALALKAATVFRVYWNDSGVSDFTVPTMTAGEMLTFAVTRRGSSGNWTVALSVNGAAVQTLTETVNPEYTGAWGVPTIGRIGNDYGGILDLHHNADIRMMAWAYKEASDAQVRAFSQDPKSILKPVFPGYTYFTSTDVAAPTLTSPTGTQTGGTTADGTVSTNEGNGTMYAIVDTSATPPSVAQIQAGNGSGGGAAAFSDSQAISSTGVKTFNATGLTASTTYYFYFQHKDAAANDSTVAASTSFTTTSGFQVAWARNANYVIGMNL